MFAVQLATVAELLITFHRRLHASVLQAASADFLNAGALEAAPRGRYLLRLALLRENPAQKTAVHPYAPPCRPRTATSFSKNEPEKTGRAAFGAVPFSRAWMIGG